ncbi:TetR/AcrR family transcriptional regulator [Alteromonas sp. ASW11-36]|uniref:TetR/AcrR family transcriptional regulator n=1 Tax=Alteromonas arenosi TaxID=3055817 RepID=A0ABT7SYS9_9ALTE|nr:TetR/AcrR family transcriptional regulator [Alteromonas sp. ASW11-36]MDM7861333.1 TetR/AcrR family transcriptional regulator [Alteromonas sp. ASW11-36]
MTVDSRQSKKEVTRLKNELRILDAAEKLFSQAGYDGASMSMIAKEASVPKANVLYYFKSKDNLYEAVIDRIVSTWNLGLDNITPAHDPAEVLYNYIRAKVKLAIKQPMQSKLFASEIIRGAPYLKDYLRVKARPWLRDKVCVFEAWMQQGKMDTVDPNHLLFTIWSATQYYADFEAEVLLVMNKIEYEDADFDAITQSVASIILKGVGLTIPDSIKSGQS